MPAAYTTLTIGDGTTTADLVDGINYGLKMNGWAPQVTYRLGGALWRRGPHADVTEEITVDVLGSTATTLFSNLDKLAKLMDQAGRWAEVQGVTAVTIQVLPQGSNGAALSAVVYGQRGGPAVINPASWNDQLMVYEIEDVQLQFRRAGPWLAASDTATASSGTNPSIRTATFGSSHVTPSPLRIDVTGYTGSADYTGEGFLIVADAANKLAVINAEASTGGVDISTSVADASNFALSNVLRIETESGDYAAGSYFSSLPSTVRTVSFYASVRNNSTTSSALLGVIASDATSIFDTYSSYRTIPPGILSSGGSNRPIVYHLATLRLNAPLTSFRLHLPGASATVDVDTIVMLGRDGTDDEVCRAVPFGTATPASGSGNWMHVFDPRALTHPTPFVGTEMTSGGAQAGAQWGGDPYLLTVGDTVSAVVLQTMPYSGYWRHVTSGSATSLGFTATRRKAFFTPQ